MYPQSDFTHGVVSPEPAIRADLVPRRLGYLAHKKQPNSACRPATADSARQQKADNKKQEHAMRQQEASQHDARQHEANKSTRRHTASVEQQATRRTTAHTPLHLTLASTTRHPQWQPPAHQHQHQSEENSRAKRACSAKRAGAIKAQATTDKPVKARFWPRLEHFFSTKGTKMSPGAAHSPHPSHARPWLRLAS